MSVFTDEVPVVVVFGYPSLKSDEDDKGNTDFGEISRTSLTTDRTLRRKFRHSREHRVPFNCLRQVFGSGP